MRVAQRGLQGQPAHREPAEALDRQTPHWRRGGAREAGAPVVRWMLRQLRALRKAALASGWASKNSNLTRTVSMKMTFGWRSREALHKSGD